MKKIALMMLVAIAAIACNKQDEIVPEINVTTTEFTVPVEGSEEEPFLVQFNANVAWTAALKEASEWCSIAPNSGVAGDATLSVYALENELEETRSVTIVITAGSAVKEVTVTQEAVFIPRLAASDPAYIPLAGGTTTVEVTANVEYTATLDAAATWLTMTQEGNVLTFTAATANDGFAARSATVTFATDYEEVGGTVTVSQEGRAAKLWTKTTADFEGYDPTQKVRLAKYGEKLLVANTTKVYVLNPATGAVESVIPMPQGVAVQNVLVDDAGNLLIAADAGVNADLVLYYVADIANPAPEALFTYNTGNYYATDTGNLRVKGNVKGNALVTATASAGAGGAVLFWEFKNGETDGWHWTNVPYQADLIAYACAAPAGPSLSDGIFYIGYNGSANDLYYTAAPVTNGASTWAATYVTGSGWMENWNCISTAEWKDHKYAAILSSCHFNYDDAEMHLLNVDDPAAAQLIYSYSGTYDVERSADWANLNWTAGGTFSDVILISAGDVMLMAYIDSNFGVMSCVAIK